MLARDRGARWPPGGASSGDNPGRVTYVYYEQYLTVVGEGLFTLALCLVPTFLVSFVLLGMDLRSSVATLITITMILLDTVGIMALWDIPYNAVALINLVAVRGMRGGTGTRGAGGGTGIWGTGEVAHGDLGEHRRWHRDLGTHGDNSLRTWGTWGARAPWAPHACPHPAPCQPRGATHGCPPR